MTHHDQGNRSYIMAITLVATLGGLLFGYDTAVISGAVKSLQGFFIEPLTHDPQLAAKVILQYRISVAVVIAIIVYATGAILVKLYGRRKGALIAGIVAVAALIAVVVLLRNPLTLTEETANALKGFTVSSALIGCIIGGSIGGFVSRKLGRRQGLLLAAFLFSLSAVGSAIPEKMNIFMVQPVISFIIYRIIGGIGVGLASMLSPMYIAEIAPSRIRGRLVSWNQFAIIFGMLVVYFVNYYIAYTHAGDDTWLKLTGWRWMFASETIPALLFFLLLFVVPETPRYLVLAGRENEAEKVLEKVSGTSRAATILAEIRDTLRERSVPWLSFGGMVLFIGIMLSVFQQFVGINVVLYYAPEIFRNMGSATDTALLQTAIVGTINLLFTVLAIVTVDRFGRKPLQIIGALGMAVAMFGLGMTFYLQRMGMGALVFMLMYVAFFAMSWGPVTWVLLSEIFPNSIRGAMSIAVAAQWVANLIVSWTFPMMNDNSALNAAFHHGFSYWIYGAMGILAAWFVWRLVPETKGRSLEEIEKLWKKP